MFWKLSVFEERAIDCPKPLNGAEDTCRAAGRGGRGPGRETWVWVRDRRVQRKCFRPLVWPSPASEALDLSTHLGEAEGRM